MNKTNKIFPIQNEAACALKWSWLTLYLSADMFNMCHRTGGFSFDRGPTSEFKDFNNHPKLVEERKRMVNNQWPEDSCGYCKRVEDAGGQSERQIFTKKEEWNPHEIANSGVLTNDVTPKVIEVYFKNTCNLACTYCTPMFSSKIEAEIKKHGPASKYYQLDGNFSVSPTYSKRKAQFWEWMREHSHKINAFHILGGEPLYQKEEFEETLSFFGDSTLDNSRVNIKMFSNLMHKPHLFKEKVASIEKMIATGLINSWTVVCSIDAWGPEQEYSRFGIDLEQWEENFKILMDSNMDVKVHSTICPLTLPTNYELREKVLSYQEEYRKPIHHSWNIIQNPPFLDPTKFGEHMLDDLNKLINLVDENTEEYSMLTGYYSAIENTEPDIEMLREFVKYSDNMDKRRNLDWRSIYPKLNTYIEDLINE